MILETEAVEEEPYSQADFIAYGSRSVCGKSLDTLVVNLVKAEYLHQLLENEMTALETMREDLQIKMDRSSVHLTSQRAALQRFIHGYAELFTR